MRRISLWLPLTLTAAGLAGVFPALQVMAQPPCAPGCGQVDQRRQGLDTPNREQYSPMGEAMREILRIRQQQGDLLRGTVLNNLSNAPVEGHGNAGGGAGDACFSAILREVVGESPPPQSSHTDPWPARTGAQRPGTRGRGTRAKEGGDGRLAASLRAAGRELDRKANELEEQRRFSRADQLRELAARLRREARVLEPAEGGG